MIRLSLATRLATRSGSVESGKEELILDQRELVKEGTMKRLALISALLAFALCALAQDYPAQSGKGSSTNETKVQGCLSRSNGGYILTDKSGAAYQLAGDTSKLTDHVGREVEIKGTRTVSREASGAAASEAKEAAPARIDVTAVKQISSTCTSSSDSGKPPMNEEPPMSEKPPGPPPR